MRATLALLSLLFVATAARAADPRIHGFRIELDGDRVLASLVLTDAFNHRFRERVDSGLPTAILYRFELDLDRKHWWDRELAGNTLEVVATYDAVERTYAVHLRLDGKLIESRTVRDRAALEAAMTHVERVPVFTLPEELGRKRLLLKARAEFGMRTILSVIPATLATDWQESPKFRRPYSPPPEAPPP
ncbi:MAG TPA: DUF4390 domain-containing protein [Thermoanaerobaculia bacterium]